VSRKSEYKTNHVGKGATVGANATIICGHNIGSFSFIGAGAVVTKDVKPYSLVLGNPARHIGWMSEYGQRLNFNGEGIAICPESGEQYMIKDNQVSKIA
jgi:UDP-2-acetamido-3-amino-2,3-dideoxy-glucuronate N-acetyltransferase